MSSSNKKKHDKSSLFAKGKKAQKINDSLVSGDSFSDKDGGLNSNLINNSRNYMDNNPSEVSIDDHHDDEN